MYENICISCFADMGAQSVCPHCGCPVTGKRKHALLPARYVLRDRYLIGEALTVDKNGICYKAMDLQERKIVEVQEYFPQEFVTRERDGVTVIPLSSGDECLPEKDMRVLLQNAKTMMRFAQCDGLLQIFDAFEANQTVYIVNEYLEGMSLEEYLHTCGGAVDVETALSVVLPILDGLTQLHRAELIHRAVTPKNIILTSDNSVKLINFVFLKEAAPFRESEMTVYFSPGYAPSEQYVNKERRGPYTDIYSVGAVLYRMLLGAPPQDAIERRSEDRLRRQLKEADLPDYIVLCICKAMDMNKDVRFKNAADMKDALLRKNGVVDVDGYLDRVRKRRQIAVIVGLSVLLAALLLFLGFLIYRLY